MIQFETVYAAALVRFVGREIAKLVDHEDLTVFNSELFHAAENIVVEPLHGYGAIKQAAVLAYCERVLPDLLLQDLSSLSNKVYQLKRPGAYQGPWCCELKAYNMAYATKLFQEEALKAAKKAAATQKRLARQAEALATQGETIKVQAPGIYSDLPIIIYIIDLHDGGPIEDGMDRSATCPHCGAGGRYVYTFQCSDGTTRGAMKGCIQHFKRHWFAEVAEDILYKEKELARSGRKLSGWDTQILDAIRGFAQGCITEDAVTKTIQGINRSKAAYRVKRYGR